VSCSIRFVIHYQISDADVGYALACVEVCESLDPFPSFTVIAFDFSCDSTISCFQKAIKELLEGSTELGHSINGATKSSYGH
jgi:threonine aldolase